MKRKSNRLRVKRLFILGAGASYSASMTRSANSNGITPLDAHFCERILDLDPIRPTWVRQSRDYVDANWKDRTEFGTYRSLEAAVIRQLGHLEFIQAIHRRRRTSSVTPNEWLSHLSHLMCYVLRHGRENSKRTYASFAGKVFPTATAVPSQRDRIVTFNYDDLLDRHLFTRATIQQIYFDRIKDSRDAADRRASRFQHPLIVKLHGSVNWRCEAAEFQRLLAAPNDAEHEIPSVWFASRGTSSPADDSYPLIIPPLPVKPITSINLFQFLWTKAYEYLHEAEQIIVCGYSLPDTDRLALSLFGNFTNKVATEIVVVDPTPSVLAKWRDLFRGRVPASARWSYFDDFADYVHRM